MSTIRAIRGDITRVEVDVVVNAANEHLQHGGGVAAALSRAGGPAVQTESDAWLREHGPVRPGTAAITTAGSMPARWIVHVVGPRFRDGQDNAALLKDAVDAALDAAAGLGARSVALPAISAGIFGYPRADATRVIAEACRRWLSDHAESLDEIRLVGYDEGSYFDFEQALSGS